MKKKERKGREGRGRERGSVYATLTMSDGKKLLQDGYLLLLSGMVGTDITTCILAIKFPVCVYIGMTDSLNWSF